MTRVSTDDTGNSTSNEVGCELAGPVAHVLRGTLSVYQQPLNDTSFR